MAHFHPQAELTAAELLGHLRESFKGLSDPEGRRHWWGGGELSASCPNPIPGPGARELLKLGLRGSGSWDVHTQTQCPAEPTSWPIGPHG